MTLWAKMFSSWSTRRRRSARNCCCVLRRSISLACTRSSTSRMETILGATSPRRTSTVARKSANASGVPSSVARSSGSAGPNPPFWSFSTNSALASVRNGFGSSPTRMTAMRQISTLGTTPGLRSRGATPARISEDFPAPLSPTMSRKGILAGADRAPYCVWATLCSCSTARVILRSRPKKIAACAAS